MEYKSSREESEAPKKPSWLRRFWKSWGDCFVIFAVVVLLFTVVFRFEKVPTASMEPTIPTGTMQLSWCLPYRLGDPLPKRGDVISFWSAEYGEVMVKRVIGLPGEKVSFAGGNVWIDGERLEESYLPEQGITECAESFTVPTGCVFFLGDNRTGSLDARYWEEHYIAAEELQSKVLFVVSIGKDRSWTGVRWIGK